MKNITDIKISKETSIFIDGKRITNTKQIFDHLALPELQEWPIEKARELLLSVDYVGKEAKTKNKRQLLSAIKKNLEHVFVLIPIHKNKYGNPPLLNQLIILKHNLKEIGRESINYEMKKICVKPGSNDEFPAYESMPIGPLKCPAIPEGCDAYQYEYHGVPDRIIYYKIKSG